MPSRGSFDLTAAVSAATRADLGSLAVATILLTLTPVPAPAIDFSGGCGASGVPTTGWNGHTDAKHRVVTMPCGGTFEEFTATFNGTITAEDDAADGIVVRIVDDDSPAANDVLLEYEFESTKLDELAVGTEIHGIVTFFLYCNSLCEVVGSTIEKVEIWDRGDPAKIIDTVSFADATSRSSGSSGESEAEIALEDDDGEDYHRLCNKLDVTCTESDDACSWQGSPRLEPGERALLSLDSPVPAFSDETTMTFGLDGAIEVIDEVIESPERLWTEIAVPVDQIPGELTVYATNVEGVSSYAPLFVDPSSWATNRAGWLRLSMTDRGAVGHVDERSGLGRGLGYPLESAHHLRMGSLWVGSSPGLVANRDYDADPAPDWVPSADVPLQLESVDGVETIRGAFIDQGGLMPHGLNVDFEARFVDTPELDDTALLRYWIENRGPDVSGVYAGLYLDLDIEGDPEDDLGEADRAIGTAWLSDPEGVHVGARVLTCSPDDGRCWPTAGIGVQDVAFLEDLGHVPDETKYAWMSGEGTLRELSRESRRIGDRAILVAAGPIDLAAGERREIAFAIGAGESLADLLANLEAARADYEQTALHAPEGLELVPPRLSLAPNPTRRAVNIRLDLPRGGLARVGVFDARGRRVRALAAGRRTDGTSSLTWDGRDDAGRRVAPGVYVIRVRTDETESARSVTMIR